MADPSIWPNVVTAVATLAAGFGGVSLTLRHGNRRFELEQRDRMRADQRQAVVDLLHAGYEWLRAAETVVLHMWTASAPQKAADSPHLTAYGEKQREFRRQLVTARVVVTEPGVAATVRTLSEVNEGMPHVFGAVLTGPRDTNGLTSPEAMDRANAVTDQAKRHLQEIEKAALEHFSQPATRMARKRFRPWRRKPVTMAGSSST